MKKIGIYNPYLETRGGGEKVCLALASVLSEDKNNLVTLITHSPVDLRPMEKYFNVDLSNVRVKNLDTDRWYLLLLFKLPVLGGFKFFISDLYVARKLRRLDSDLFINNCYQSNLPSMGKHGVYMCMFPQKLTADPEKLGRLKAAYKNFLAWLYKKFIYKSQQAGVYTYDRIVSNSAFTQSYVKKYWGLDSDILYPICDDMYQPSIKRDKVILNVGRLFGFDEGSHHKRQDFLLETFAKLDDLHKKGWQLHFAGTAAKDKKALRFVEELKEKARGLPVYWHLNTSFQELKKLYNQASIYWHATGYGSDPSKYPEKQEHFGISTLEAMSAGAIPVVINSAGQKEVIIHQENGFLWDDEAGLAKLTREAIDLSSSDYERLAKKGKATVKLYDSQSFAKNVLSIFSKYLD